MNNKKLWVIIIVCLLAITCLIFSGCGTLGMTSKYRWETTEISNSQVPNLIDAYAQRIQDWRRTGVLAGGTCAQWVSQEYQLLKKEGKHPCLIGGWHQGTMHALAGYYRDDGTLMVSDGERGPASGPGYWPAWQVPGFFPVWMADDTQTLAFADRWAE